jgi:DNA repair protein RadC
MMGERWYTNEAKIIERACLIVQERASAPDLDPLEGSKATARLCTLWIGAEPRECFGVIALDARHRPIHREILFRGSVDRATVHQREVIKFLLKHNAAAAILTHNHPSGTPDPSESDKSLTRALGVTLAIIDVQLLDHVVVAGVEYVSMAERGWVT